MSRRKSTAVARPASRGTLNELGSQLEHCQLRDRHRLQKKFHEIKNKADGSESFTADVRVLEEAIKKSRQACQRRFDAIPPKIHYPDNLPVSQRVDDIVQQLTKHQVLIVAGDTGSGKTTQLPKICLQAGFGRLGMIGHTQPRRLAALSVSTRIAEELGIQPGAGVGYQVRFNEKVSDSSFLKLMTDGILLAEIQSDRYLNQYEVLIVDEAHERSLNIDFLLGFLKQLLPKRPDLKLIITSATINVEKFSAHFWGAPVVTVTGRTYPVETRYAPVSTDNSESGDESEQLAGILASIKNIELENKPEGQNSGDILVFLSGEREIRETANFLRKQKLRDTEILPLYARLRHSEQSRIFQPHRGRRIVLATNVAETSLTVPGINYVIDTGFARIGRYSLQSKVQRLPIEPISQASANQRKGRCGRLANGVCIRLYSEVDLDSRPPFTDPEIRRTNLASVILRMKYLKLGEAEKFPFLEPPEQKAINEGSRLLIELNALNPSRQLTDFGRQMASLPVDPRFGRMLIAAQGLRSLREVLIIVSALTSQDPREISQENRQLALQKLARFNHPESDFLSLVKLWDEYENLRQTSTQSQLRKFCKTHYLSFMRMREWRELHRQLTVSCQRLGFKLNRDTGDYQSVHQAIITGSLNQIACLDERRTYTGNRNRKFSLFGSSVLSARPPKWIVTGEQIETSGTFASMAAKIDPGWVEQAALHLVKREYFEPHWSKKRQEVMAYEKVQLYGLVLTEKSEVAYSNVDRSVCRQIFINEAMAGELIDTALPFYRQNQVLIAKMMKQEEKLRRPDIIVSEREIANFYAARIPDTICSTLQLEQWWKEESKEHPESLNMTAATLLESEAALARLNDYPDSTPIQQNRLKIDYVFAPGNDRDGATLELPEAIVNQLTQADVDWSVPGIIREKCISLLKGLPKALRKNFIPVSGFVDEILPSMRREDGELVDALLTQVWTRKQVQLSRDMLLTVALPSYLQVKIRVLDASGKEIAYGADITALQKRLPGATDQPGGVIELAHELEVTGVTDWVFNSLPKLVEIGDDLVLIRYPALVDEGTSVGVKLFENRAVAEESQKRGLLRLYMLSSVQQRNMLRKQFVRLRDSMALKLPKELKDVDEDAVQASYAAAFNIGEREVCTRADFDQALADGKPRIVNCGEKIERLLGRVMDAGYTIRRKLHTLDHRSLDYLRRDIEHQLDTLVYDHFLQDTGLAWLKEYPRYFEAIEFRLAKVPHVGEKDEQFTSVLAQFWQRYLGLKQQLVIRDKAELHLLRWMIEELRVSLFAQPLGTRMPVSANRVEKQFSKVERR